MAFRAQSGTVYLNTVPLSPVLVNDLLDIFARENAIDLAADLVRVMREARRQECEEGIPR